MSEVGHLENQINEIEVDRALQVDRFGALSDQIKSLVNLNKAHTKLTEARANIRTAWSLAILVGVVLAVVWTIHLA